MPYNLVQALHAQHLNMDYSPEDIIDMVRNVYLVKYGHEEPIISEITKKETELLEQLGVDLSSPSLDL